MSRPDDTRLLQYCTTILKREKGVIVVFVYDKFGTLLLGRAKEDYRRRLGRQPVRSGVVKTRLSLDMSEVQGLDLGKTKFVMACRTKYNSMTFALPIGDLAVGVTFKPTMNPSRLYERILAIRI